MQEIQEALDERQNNLDSLLTHNQPHAPLEEPFAFESEIDTVNRSSHPPIQSETNVSNETVPLLAVPNEKKQSEKQHSHRPQSTWTSAKDPLNIKKEAITPVIQISASSSLFKSFNLIFQTKTKRRQSKTSSNSKQNRLSSNPSMRQMTMTQLFDPMESPQSTTNSTPVKQEPQTPVDDTVMFMPESLVGLAQPSDTTSDHENDQVKCIFYHQIF